MSTDQSVRARFLSVAEQCLKKAGSRVPMPRAEAEESVDRLIDENLGWSLERGRQNGVPDRDVVEIMKAIREGMVDLLMGKLTARQFADGQVAENARIRAAARARRSA